jgi:hypothetical protein
MEQTTATGKSRPCVALTYFGPIKGFEGWKNSTCGSTAITIQ